VRFPGAIAPGNLTNLTTKDIIQRETHEKNRSFFTGFILLERLLHPDTDSCAQPHADGYVHADFQHHTYPYRDGNGFDYVHGYFYADADPQAAHAHPYSDSDERDLPVPGGTAGGGLLFV
jgi:hypothetical protein